jgi:hypothetical protein
VVILRYFTRKYLVGQFRIVTLVLRLRVLFRSSAPALLQRSCVARVDAGGGMSDPRGTYLVCAHNAIASGFVILIIGFGT